LDTSRSRAVREESCSAYNAPEAGIGSSGEVCLKVRLSVVIPSLDEAGRIQKAIENLRWADEVIVADGGSRDGTVELATLANAKVLHVPGGTIASQRNAAIAAARNQWVLTLDVDEHISRDLRMEIARTLEAPGHEAYRIPFHNFYLGHEMRHGRWGNESHVRLFQRNRRFLERRVHEHLEPISDVGSLRGFIEHRPYRSLAHHVEKMVRYARWGAEDLADRGREAKASDLTVRPLWRFIREYVFSGGWRDGRAGLLVAALSGFSALLKYAHLQELEWQRDSRTAVVPEFLALSEPALDTPPKAVLLPLES